MGKKILIFLILIALIFVGYTKYTRMVTMQKGLVTQWLLIEGQYEHKSDVIFDISKYLDSYTEEELVIIEEVTLARNAAAKIEMDPDNISEEGLDRFRKAYRKLIDLQAELQAVARQYPEISDRQEYRELLAELDGTEIRIANERSRLNEQVEKYNKYINGFFNLAIAQVFGFHEWPVFAPILGE